MTIQDVIIMILLGVSILIGIIAVVLLLKKSNAVTSFTGKQEEFFNERMQDLHELVMQDGKAETRMLIEAMNIGNTTMQNAQKNSQDSLRNIVEELVKQQNANAEALKHTVDNALNSIKQNLSNDLKDARLESAEQAKTLRESLEKQLKTLEIAVGVGLDKIRENNEKKLTEMTQSNELKLNEMRGTVEEKLQSTLHERITTSFSTVTAQLAEVQKGLGEMQNLTSNVSSLNRVLSGVKVRGIWGEVSLDGLLEQILSPSQYGKQVNIQGKNAVDFAVFMPGNEDKQVLLPIDAKFPFDDYERLVQASEMCDKDAIALHRNNLFKAIKLQAKNISTKYIDSPKTTSFAIMYLPIEGLYAEVVRDAALVHDIQTNHNVMLAGPTTLTALLTALQVGFRTLTMQKHSKAIWDTLQDFKKNLFKFVGLLEKSKKNASTIVDDMTDSLKRVELIDKQLKKIDVYESDTAGEIMNAGESNEV